MLLQTVDIRKQFHGVYALNGIDFELDEGEIHGLVGENGAGKSTLIKILTGVYALDQGDIFWNGQKARITDPVESRELGIHVIHQDHVLIPSFTAVENSYLGMEYPMKHGRIDWRAMQERVRKKADELGIELDFSKTAAEMSPPQRTCVEIVRAMMTDCKLLILDEPTASLTDRESEILFAIIRRLKERGTAILYVTHRMDEILRLTDRVTILRNGIKAGVVKTSEVDRAQLIALMTEEWEADSPGRSSQIGEVRLDVRHLSSRDGIVKDMSLQAHAGEILGVFGLGGSGRTEFLECIYGYRQIRSGEVWINGALQKKHAPGDSISSGMVMISEDRRGKAMIGNLNIRENVVLSCIHQFSRSGIQNRRAESRAVQEKTDSLQVRMVGIEQRAAELSGGNQQKVVFAKALMTEPEIFLCDEPTQAVDVRTRNEIHKLLRQMADEGKAVVFVSSDLKEILEVSDHIQIVSGGYTRQLLKNEGLQSKEVLACCYQDSQEYSR